MVSELCSLRVTQLRERPILHRMTPYLFFPAYILRIDFRVFGRKTLLVARCRPLRRSVTIRRYSSSLSDTPKALSRRFIVRP